MSRTLLQTWLVELSGFRARLLELTKAFVIGQFDLTSDSSTPLNDSDLKYLLFCASLLSTSAKEKEQDAALRIAQYCLTSAADETQRATAAFILDQLANEPAIRLGTQRGSVPDDFFERLDGLLLYEHWQRRLELTVETMAGEQLHLNRFQKSVWSGANDADWLSVSAPTSAGKSFVIKKLIEEEARRLGRGIAVYLVPTRALIQEVESDFIHYFKACDNHSTSVSSMPLIDTLDPSHFNIFVLTQERYHLLLTAKPDLSVDLLVVDEAQKIGDHQRGVLLQQVVDRTAEINQRVRVLFASPHTVNPGALLGAAPESAQTKEMRVEQVTVNQNLLWAAQKPNRPKDWNLSILVDSEEHHLGSFKLPDKPHPVSKRLPFIALALGAGGGNLVYVDSPGVAEKTANQLYEMLPPDVLSASKLNEVTPLIDLARSTVHRSYALAKVLQRGVAFHYGNMPYLMRCEIERLFREGHVSFLVCTSTLLEGVNLPCRNIFVRGPRSGRGTPMTLSDFWNLAGRAGRWGAEFQGNIVCIDVQHENLWPDPPRTKVPARIKPAVALVSRQFDEFIAWVLEEDPLATKVPTEFPQILNFLISEVHEKGSILDLYWLADIEPRKRSELQAAIIAVSQPLGIPLELVRRNPGIDPRLMGRMLQQLEQYGNERLDDLMPPDSASDDAVDTFTRVFSLIDRACGPVFGSNSAREWQLALLVTQWLRGHSLAKLIAARINALRRKGQEVQLPKEIRQVMGDVENYARFTVPKYLACYIDLLKYFLVLRQRTDLLQDIGDFGLLLEFGVSENTQLSLISLGLSRTTVVTLFELMPASDWDVCQCVNWLKKQDIDSLDIPVLVRREILDKLPELRV
ncbi:MAG: DEAD/DEAH box helicase [Geobacter sp.]|nr:DEAD/DEAH box helicase [Geobacter sp.]